MSAKFPVDSTYDLEQQFILRMTDPAAAESLCADIDAGVSFKDNFTLEFKPDMRHALVRYNGQVYQGRLMDLPCIIESLKTTDKRSFYKTADICQMMICTQGEEFGPLRGTAAYLDDRTKSWSKQFDPSRETREFQFLHGITPPLKNVLRRRFRKSRRKRLVDMPKIEKEVKQLLRADLQAVGVKWEVIWSDPQPSGRSNQGTAPDGDVGHGGGSGSAAHSDSVNRRQTADDEEEEEFDDGSRPFPIDRRDVFGDISSSSSNSSSVDDSSDSSGEGRARSDDERRSARRRSPRVRGRGAVRESRQPPQPNPLTVARPITTQLDETAGLSSLKNELAAELLLSDSGEEDDTFRCTTTQDDEEEDQQASAAAHLVAHTLADDGPTVDEDDLNDVDEDDDEMVHRGGELLDDAALIDLDSAATLADLQEVIESDCPEMRHI